MKEDDIDFVLVWDSSKETAITQASSTKREIFQRHLIEEGLELQEEQMEDTEMQVVKIRAPTDVLRRYTEILKLRMPTKIGSELRKYAGSNEALFESSQVTKKPSWKPHLMKRMELDPTLFPPEAGGRFFATYSRDKEYLFDMRPSFFTHGIRTLIIDFILRQTRYTQKSKTFGEMGENAEFDFGVGIESLISDGVYCGAYPLHDGDVKTAGSMRNLLYNEWGSVSKMFKNQPLDAINSYFGVKVATYFAWLGFYTEMLIPVSIFGVIAFLYGVFTLSENQIANDICGGAIVEPMCPHCDQFCGYWNISETCAYSKITHLFDNDATVVFSILSSFWTVVFLERWKRYSAEIKYRWDLSSDNENDDNPRPNYLARLQKANIKKKLSGRPTTNSGHGEPKIDFWRTKLPNILISMSSVIFLIFMALAAVVSVILYRLSIKFVLLSKWAPSDPSVHGWGLMVANMTAVCLNLVLIVFLNWIYSFLALYLTEFELHRTQTDFDDSLTLKMYLLQFINYYASIFYIAFFKGRFAGTPHEYTHFFGYRHEECGSGGCMAELCVQLAIVMVGKQALNAIIETGKPIFVGWIKVYLSKGKGEVKPSQGIPHDQTARDLHLQPWTTLSFFPEYLEMVLQFGFSTIFVSAFPLASFFALLNNVFEIRLDGKKMLKYYQRPVGAQVASIGIWYGILNAVTKLAVLCNALIIAFTSNFIPKLLYRLELGNLDGFLENSLSSFNTSLFDENTRPRVEEHHISSAAVCRYHSFRKGHRSSGTEFFWELWVARLLFVVIYQNGIFLGVMIIQWMIPDVPHHVQEKIRQENRLINKVVIARERSRKRIDLNFENEETVEIYAESNPFRDSRLENQNIEDSPGARLIGPENNYPDSLEDFP